MPLLTVVLTLMIVAVALYAFDRWVPETARTTPVKKIVIVLVIVACVWWLLQLSGILGAVATVPFPHR